MDPRDVERVALLSIKPEYAKAIFGGQKTVEFRRSRLAPDIEIAIVYATMPVGQIIGCFRIAGHAESTPDGLWRRFRRRGAISRREYFDYYAGAERAYAIEIADATSLREPVPLDSIASGLRAPQSFHYLPAPLVAPLVTRRSRDSVHSFPLRLAYA